MGSWAQAAVMSYFYPHSVASEGLTHHPECGQDIPSHLTVSGLQLWCTLTHGPLRPMTTSCSHSWAFCRAGEQGWKISGNLKGPSLWLYMDLLMPTLCIVNGRSSCISSAHGHQCMHTQDLPKTPVFAPGTFCTFLLAHFGSDTGPNEGTSALNQFCSTQNVSGGQRQRQRLLRSSTSSEKCQCFPRQRNHPWHLMAFVKILWGVYNWDHEILFLSHSDLYHLQDGTYLDLLG